MQRSGPGAWAKTTRTRRYASEVTVASPDASAASSTGASSANGTTANSTSATGTGAARPGLSASTSVIVSRVICNRDSPVSTSVNAPDNLAICSRSSSARDRAALSLDSNAANHDGTIPPTPNRCPLRQRTTHRRK
ncbi:hypothetical protein ACH4UM_38385 [Streptomyces sp. NPDC020801]|uniref:hypothetical protein n=1 Tax=Streptomyces sp. NPDC020801 TaxID=3365093 RepID=UPI00378D9889